MTMSVTPCIVILLSLFSLTAAGGESHGVTIPVAIIVESTPLKLNGMGVRTTTLLNIKAYVAGLYLETASDNPAQIIAPTALVGSRCR